MPNPINKRMEFPEAIDTAVEVYNTYRSILYVESVAYQSACSQQLREKGVQAVEVRPGCRDKATRLKLITARMANGQVVFPAEGCELLIEQLLGFGKEKHDDLVDAFVYLVSEVFSENGQVMTMNDIFFA